jgi:hypothetical protein
MRIRAIFFRRRPVDTLTKPTEPDYPDSAGPILAAVVREQLGQERSRKNSLEQRGIAVITSSGVLVALLLGIAGLAGKDVIKHLPVHAMWLSLGALVFFTGAAILGLATNWASEMNQPSIKQLTELVSDYWSVPATDAEQFVAESYLGSLKSYREQGNKKANCLVWALRLEVLAIGVLAVAVGDILWFGLK